MLELPHRDVRELFDAAPEAMLVTDRSGIVDDANAAAARLLGRSVATLVGTPLTVFIAEEERLGYYELLDGVSSRAPRQEGSLALAGAADERRSIVVARTGLGGLRALHWTIAGAPYAPLEPARRGERSEPMERLREELTAAREVVGQLQRALDSRVIIEQAKGVLVARHGVDPASAFARLRHAARSSGERLHELAHQVVHAGVELRADPTVRVDSGPGQTQAERTLERPDLAPHARDRDLGGAAGV